MKVETRLFQWMFWLNLVNDIKMIINKEDLMIGDWVMIKDYPMDFQPEKMTANHFVRSLCEFEAIPITKKFLLNNMKTILVFFFAVRQHLC